MVANVNGNGNEKNEITVKKIQQRLQQFMYDEAAQIALQYLTVLAPNWSWSNQTKEELHAAVLAECKDRWKSMIYDIVEIVEICDRNPKGILDSLHEMEACCTVHAIEAGIQAGKVIKDKS